MHQRVELRRGESSLCVRCGTTLQQRTWFDPTGSWALLLAAFFLVFPVALAPFVTLAKFGRERDSGVWDVGDGFWQFGDVVLAPWVWFCGVLAPLMLLATLLASRSADLVPRSQARVRTFLRRFAAWLASKLEFWAMPEVQVLGVLVAFFKLGDVVDVSVDAGLWCYGAAAICLLAAWRVHDRESPPDQRRIRSVGTSSPPPVQPAMALTLAAAILLIPANVLPVMHVAQLGGPASDPTIMEGVRLLVADDLWGLAAIVFTASIVVPGLKLGGMLVLTWHARHSRGRRARELTRLHRFLDLIGRWSMLDVFLVGFLTGAVQFGRLAVVEPRPGIVAFAAVVILTMLATRSFDSRWLWQSVPSGAAYRHG